MKRVLFSAILTCVSFLTFAQSTPYPTQLDLEHATWVDGDVLVRFSDDVEVKFTPDHLSHIPSIDAVLADYVITEVEQLFWFQKELPTKETGFMTIGGQWVEYPNLKNIYRIHIEDSTGGGVFTLISALENLGDDFVKYAEPNYYSGILGNYTPNDTLYPNQWNVAAIQADTVQARMAADSTVSDTNMVIAIIDTGVDKDHRDLKNKMWVNLAEINGLPNVDDDGNGFKDDKYGWDFINNNGNPMDDNMHGTHCAGIAAAETNNNTGIAGISPGAKIMAVKVMQSGGYGAAADIAQGILYSANNGADVISMSIGGTGVSQVTYDACAVAYAYSFLVAAAGNNGKCIGRPSPPDYKCPDGKTPQQFYPASWSFVLGVESSAPSGGKSGFSNYDEDGPIQSEWPNLLNYEVRAPGSQILSTIPAGTTGDDNRYKVTQGTSMACPAVAGGVSLLKSFKPTFTHEKVFLYLIKTQTNNIQLNDAIDFILPPELTYVTNEVVDTLGGDEDGRPDAGEIVELVLSIKNTGGYNSSIWAKIELDPLENPNLVNFINPVRHFGSASEYAVIQNNLPDSNLLPFKFQLDSNIANARGIKFNITMWTADSTFIGSKGFELTVQNGIEFGASYYAGTTVLTPNKYYLITGNTLFDTLIIKPGTTIYCESSGSIGAHVITAIGKPDSLISISGVRGGYWLGVIALSNWVYNYGYNAKRDSKSIIQYAVISDYAWQYPAPHIFSKFFEVSNVIIKNSILGEHLHADDDTPIVSDSVYFTGNWMLNNSGVYSRASNSIYKGTISDGSKWRAFNNVVLNCRLVGGNNYEYNDDYLVEGHFKIDNNISSVIDTSSGTDFITYKTINYIGGPYIMERKYGNNIYSNFMRKYTGLNAILNNTTYYLPTASQLLSGDGRNDVYLNYTLASDVVDFRQGPVPQFKAPGGSVTPVFEVKNYYLGGQSESYLKDNIVDYFDVSSLRVVGLTNLMSYQASSEPHGYVRDILVDSKSIHYADNPYNNLGGVGIIGNSTHKFEVVFNRPMNVNKAPLLTFGIREPWTQNIVADSSSWSADSTVFTAYTTITPLTQSDGINRVSVRLAEDNEHFPCPTENVRFEMRIASTGSLSADFEAVGDTGAINLTWGIPEDAVADFLGTNMYRIDSAHLSNPSFVYNKMSIDSALVDSTVLAGTWYGYYFKIVRTNLTEMNSSDTVWARPWQGKPAVTTLSPSNVTHNSVTLRGRGNPNYLATQVRFNYGLTSNYTTNTTFQNIGNGSSGVVKTVNLSGLTPGTTYHYRIEGTNAEGTSYGHDSTFTTKAFPTLNFRYDSTLCLMDTLKITNNTTISTGSMNYAWEVRRNGSLVYTSALEEPAFYMNQAGSYTVKLTVSSDQAVTTSKTGILTVDPIPTPTVTASGSVTLCQGGTVTLSAPSGYTYLWSNGATTQTIVVSASGSYSVEVTNANGCSGTSPAQNVVVNALPTAAITSANSATSFCTGSSLTLSAPAGMTGYQWKLDGTTISGATSASYSAAAAGSYTVLITNASGCTSLSAGFTVTENALPTAAVSALSSTTFCQGDSVVLSAPAGYTYLWSNGATTQSITASTAGTYSVAVTNASGCSVTSSPVTVTVNYIPTMSVTNTGALSFCTGGSTTLTAAGGFASYLWSNGATTQSIIVNAAGTYSVTGYTAAGCTSQSSATSVVANALPVATVSASGTTTFCLGDSVVLSAPAGYTYLWSTGATTQSISAKDAGVYSVTVTDGSGCSATSASTTVSVNVPTRPGLTAGSATTFCQGASVVLSMPSGYSNRMWNTGATSQSIVATTSGDYYVMAQTSNGCQVVSDTITVMVNALPVATATTSDPTTFCVGGAATLHAPAGMTTYQWYKDGIAVVGATDSTYAASVSGSYRVQVTNASGCGQLSAAQVITVNALPVASVSASGTTTFCQGDSVVLSAPAGYTYLWSNGATTQSISAKTSGAYSVTVTNANGCSASSAATTVSVNSIVTPSITANGATSFCQGGSVVLSAPSGYSSYLWSTGQSSQSITVSSAGSYSVTVTNAAGCTSQSSATSVVVNALPVASVSASGSTTFCLGDSVVLSAPAGYTYLWSTGATTQSITVTSSGSYQVTVTNTNGCSTTSASTSVQVATISTPSITANGATSFCQGESVVLTAPSGYSYLWSNGSTGSSITVTSAGSYTVTVTNAAGCSATSASVAVTIDPLPSVTATAQGATTFCPGDSVMLMANPGLSNYTWSNGQTGPSIWVYQAGTYTVEAENANGCVGQSNAIQVTVSPVPATPTVYYSNNANLLISSAPMGNQWYLNGVAIPGADSTTWYPTQNGIYSVIVTNAAGCSSESAQFNYVNIGTDEWLRAQIKLYPNPNDGKFQIAYPAEMEFETVRVLDGVGRILYEGKAETNRVELDLSKEASGLYRVELMGAKGFIYLPVTIQR
jgi:subtilisin family serine protease